MEKNKLPGPVSILILTFLTAIVWVSLNIYRTLTASPTPSVSQAISQPLTPTLNQDAIKKIESATFFNDSQIPQVIIAPKGTGAPVLVVAPSPKAIPLVTPSASPSASPTPGP